MPNDPRFLVSMPHATLLSLYLKKENYQAQGSVKGMGPVPDCWLTLGPLHWSMNLSHQVTREVPVISLLSVAWPRTCFKLIEYS